MAEKDFTPGGDSPETALSPIALRVLRLVDLAGIFGLLSVLVAARHDGWPLVSQIFLGLAFLALASGEVSATVLEQRRAAGKFSYDSRIVAILLGTVFAFCSYVTVKPSEPPGQVTLIKMEAAQPVKDIRGWHMVANVYFQNIDAAGEMFFNGKAILTTKVYADDDAAVANEVRRAAAASPMSSPSPITPNQEEWFSVISDPLQPNDIRAFRNAGQRALYFAGTIVIRTSSGESRTPFCEFALSGPPYTVHSCPV